MSRYRVVGVAEGPIGELPFRRAFNAEDMGDAERQAIQFAQDEADADLTVTGITWLGPVEESA